MPEMNSEEAVKHIGHPGCATGDCLCRVFRHDYSAKDTVLRIARHIADARASPRGVPGGGAPIDPEGLLEKIRTDLRRFDQKKKDGRPPG